MQKLSSVIVKQVARYDASVRDVVFDMMTVLDAGRIQRGSRVLIKPNLLAPASPQSGILTHPSIVKAVAEYILAKGGSVQVSDSPAISSFRRILKTSGMLDALQGLDVTFSEFKTSVSVDVEAPFHTIEVAEDVFRADVIVNLAKLKTHSQMLLTLGVKNLFGCVVGLKKPEWHMRAGVDREMFARLLVRVYRTVQPSITILDGILALEGQGPSFSGSPRKLGVLMGSSDAVALDMTVCRMLGIDPDQMPTNKAAGELGLVPASIQVSGSLPKVHDFKLPEITTLLFGPSCFHGLFRKHLLQRPVSDPSECTLCGDCLRYCPAQAIRPDKKGVLFDYDRCIRCYCCIEVCSHGALHTEEPLLGKILQKAARVTSRFS